MLFHVSCQTPSIISPCQLVSWLYINFEVLQCNEMQCNVLPVLPEVLIVLQVLSCQGSPCGQNMTTLSCYGSSSV